MPIADFDLTSWCAKLKAPFNAASDSFTFEDEADLAFLLDVLDEPAHVWLNFYTATKDECVLAYLEDGELQFTRAQEGTGVQSFPAGTCVKIKDAKDGEVCLDDEEEATAEVLSILEAGKGVTIDSSGVVSLAPVTGLVAGTYGGMTVDECGRVISLTAEFPSDSIAQWDNCCDKGTTTTTGGGASSADAVSFVPQVGGCITASNLQDALEQADVELTQLKSPTSTPVASVAAGECITITGTPTNPVINWDSSDWISDGVYDGFTVTGGKITSYSPPQTALTTLIGTTPIQVSQQGAEATLSILEATTESKGSVCLADFTEYNSDPDNSDIELNDVVTIDFLTRYFDTVDFADELGDITAAQWEGLIGTASTTQPGLVQLATTTEAEGGTATDVALTPFTGKALVEGCLEDITDTQWTLYVGTATESRPALVELADATEAVDVSNDVVVLTPAKGKLLFDDCLANKDLTDWTGYIGSASLTAVGLVELASTAEALAATSTSLAMTPATSKAQFEDCLANTTLTEWTSLIGASTAGSVGLVELATPGEATDPANNTVVLTPQTGKLAAEECIESQSVADWLGHIGSASTTQSGLVEMASLAEAVDETVDDRAVTPQGVKAMIGQCRPAPVLAVTRSTLTSVTVPADCQVMVEASVLGVTAAAQLLNNSTPIDTASGGNATTTHVLAAVLGPGSHSLSLASTQSTDTLVSPLIKTTVYCTL